MLATAMSGRAQTADHFYAGAEGAVAFAQNLSILDGTGFSGDGGNRIKFDTGWRVGGYVGYSFCQYFAAQVDSGVIWNNISTIGIQSLNGVSSAHLEQVPVLAEGLFTYPLGRFKPYLLAGAGSSFGIFKGSNFQSLGGPPAYDNTDTTFAYEAGLGFTYSLSKNLEVGVAYKFFGTTDHSWTADTINLKTDGSMVHTIEATLSWRF